MASCRLSGVGPAIVGHRTGDSVETQSLRAVSDGEAQHLLRIERAFSERSVATAPPSARHIGRRPGSGTVRRDQAECVHSMGNV